MRIRFNSSIVIRLGIVAVTGCLGLGLSLPAQAAVYEQVIVLQPGWNAVFLEVQPEVRDIDEALAGLPVESVWSWNPRTSTVEFIQDPSEGLLGQSGWQVYFPRPRPEAFLTNLFRIRVNRAYLIRLAGTQPVTWRVAGRPVVERSNWIADSFNLHGFFVDPQAPPTFGSFFEGAAAHENQPIYRLGSDGIWQEVTQPYSTAIKSGEAYWVYSEGPSGFQGPLEVDVSLDDDLNYSANLTTQTLRMVNATALETDITLTQFAAASPVPLAFENNDRENGGSTWPVLPTQYSLPAFAGQEVLVNVAVQRALLPAGVAEVEHVMAISNGLGSRRLVMVAAKPVQPPAGKSAAVSYAGLWSGTAQVEAVSEAQRAGTTPVPVGRAFGLRLLIHVDDSGNVRLLKEVIQMWQEGTTVPHPENPAFSTTETPGRHVLVTKEDLIPNFTGVAMRDGHPVGLRMSSVAYDFEEEYLEMNGTFAPDGNLQVTIAMPSEQPTNPFLHKYHPDHDNLDAQFLNFRPEAYEIIRTIGLTFTIEDPTSDAPPPDWGDSELGGTYSERITGAHRNAIFVGGTFRLRRVSAVAILNG